MRNFALLMFSFFCASLNAQNNAIKEYNDFKNKAKTEYEDFRKKCNQEYAEFLKQAWESYEAGPIIPKPKDETVPPVVINDDELNKPIESEPVPIDTVVSPIIEEPQPQPLPVAPIYEKPQPNENYHQFVFFGTDLQVRLLKTKSTQLLTLNQKLSNDNLAKAWDELSNGQYDNLIRDCLEIRIRYSLCDWAYLLMIRELSETYFGEQCNASTMLMSWIYCQTGYQMRFGMTSNKLYLLIGTQHNIYEWGYYQVDGTNFYPFLHNGDVLQNNIQICGASFPEEKPMSLFIPKAQEFAYLNGNTRTIKSKRYSNATANVVVNQNLMKFYSTYPTSVLGENFVSRWAMYANTPMAKNIKEQLYPQLRDFMSGKNQLDAVNILLNWVQTGLVYEYDDKVWGGDRAFFAEESLNYPYCDCEDRSILFTRIVRDLLGLKCILIYYPGHLACAVNFTEQVNGDYIILNGQKFIITDPTYIGAPVGYTMPDMDNKTANVILLE